MADKGPILTSGIIFYLSIGAAIFQILEEPNWKSAVADYEIKKDKLLQKYPCLSKENLEEIVKAVTESAGQGVSIASKNSFNNWNWQNSVIFAATVITTIGYGNVAPKTVGGRVFCILYGLCGIPLCLTWISEVGTFFSGRTKRISQVLLRRGLTPRKVQCTCIALFLLWGLIFHLVIPPFVFMDIEGWSYLEGFHFCFTTLTTVGFGDFVAGVDPDIEYPTLYRFIVEVWIFMGLAWLSLFFSWNVYMVVEAHKVFKKRRYQRRHRFSLEERRQHEETQVSVHSHGAAEPKPSVIDIFNYLTVREEDYGAIIKQIGSEPNTERKKKKKKVTIQEVTIQDVPRSKSCNDILNDMGVIMTLEHSPRLKRRFSISDNIFSIVSMAKGSIVPDTEHDEKQVLLEDSGEDQSPEGNSPESSSPQQEDIVKRWCSWDSTEPNPTSTQSQNGTAEQEVKTNKEEVEDGSENRFTVSKVAEDALKEEEEEEGEG
ncbi:potassium channel subfamily K member 5-like [Alosa sapidissima]|uniref:potassium channel subfamily K member 5-like n=1 Tax=Alosa sapidissima TaxID=34773 RepID=UPI001C086690|nr:potassium channel subfamily K member 5-like [Alosa sapidissima]